MKYRLVGSNDYMVNPVKSILINRGVENIETFLNLDESVIHDPHLIKNMDLAVDLYLTHIKKGSKIFWQVDSDLDGYVSSALGYNYTRRLSSSIEMIFNVHDDKIHGIFSKDVPDGVGLVIVSDAGSNNIEEHQLLQERGIDVLVLDHHHCDEYSNYAVVVNNQMCDYPNKFLSGVGIVYKFCIAVDKRLGINIADDFLDLVATGLIADMMDTRNLETRYYIQQGLQSEKIKNPFIRALIDKQSYSMGGKINMTSISFYVAPLINATVRFGTVEEKLNMFKAFLEDCTETISYKPRGSTIEVEQNMAEAMARVCTNVKSRQGRARDKGVQLIEERISEKGLNQNKILIVNGTDILDQSLTGLVAMQLAQKYRRPTIILKLRDSENGVFGGSARGYDKSEIRDFRQFIIDTGCFSLAQGHDNAFGVEIDAQSIVKASKIMNEKLAHVEFDDIYDVDFVVPANKVTTKFVKSLEEMRNIWGRGVAEPFIAIVDLVVPASDIELIGKSKNTIKFKIADLEYVKFGATEEDFTALAQHSMVSMDIVGRCSLNEYNGNKTYQILIDNYIAKKSAVFAF